VNVLAWILSGLLAFAFLGAGFSKLVTPRQKLLENPKMSWASDFTNTQVKTIAGVEVLASIGVVLPWLLDIARVLTPLAAVGLAITMIGALVTHGRRGELKQALPVNSVLLAVAVAVAVIRFAQL
jgi:DoxX-like family